MQQKIDNIVCVCPRVVLSNNINLPHHWMPVSTIDDRPDFTNKEEDKLHFLSKRVFNTRLNEKSIN